MSDVNLKLDASQKGAASGVAPLVGSRVPEANLPANLAAATLAATYANALDPRLISLRSVPVASRVSVPTSGLNTAGPTQATTRIKHRLNVETGTVQLAYGNHYNNAGVETVGPNNITVKASIEFVTGSYIIPVRFGGARTIVIPPGGVVWSDPISLDLAVGDFFYSRTNVVVGSGTERWPTGWATLTADGEGVETGVDKADSGTVTANNTFCYGPLSIRGSAITLTKVLGGIGDSIMSGNGDGNTKGWWYRKFSGVIPEQRLAYPSEMAQSFAMPTRRHPRLPLIDGCTSIIFGYGINDIKSGNAAVQVKRDMITSWRYGARRGTKCYQHTLTPVTTSTDTWATTGNQTVTANEANRVAVNDWLRDGAPFTTNDFEPAAIGATGGLIVRTGAAGHPLTGLLEFADVVETARNSGIWKASRTGDGTHPNATAHQELADSFTLASVGMA